MKKSTASNKSPFHNKQETCFGFFCVVISSLLLFACGGDGATGEFSIIISQTQDTTDLLNDDDISF